MKQAYFLRGEPLLVVFLVLLLWSGARAVIGQVPPAMAQSWKAVNLAAAGQLWDRMWTLKTAELVPGKAATSSVASRPIHKADLGGITANTSAVPSSGMGLAAITPIEDDLLDKAQLATPQVVSSSASPGLSEEVVPKPGLSPIAPPPISGVTPVSPPNAASVPKSRYRWTADGWVYVRGGATRGGPSGGTVASSAGYGGSQAGAVLRYALGRGKHDPTAFLRMSGSLGSGIGSYRETAAGLAIRPSSAVPLSVMAELRAQQSAAGMTLRPAVTVVTQIAPQKLPGGFQAEIYGQGGYVAGKDATVFYDGQAIVDRPVGGLGKSGTLRAGAGTWVGGQTGASRVDLGPTASARVPAGRGAVRVSVDWRFRVAGNAQPGSGLAATVAAGF